MQALLTLLLHSICAPSTPFPQVLIPSRWQSHLDVGLGGVEHLSMQASLTLLLQFWHSSVATSPHILMDSALQSQLKGSSGMEHLAMQERLT